MSASQSACAPSTDVVRVSSRKPAMGWLVPGVLGLWAMGCGPDREGLNPGECSNGIDDDNDAVMDCADPDCKGSADCETNHDSSGTTSVDTDVPVGDFDDIPEVHDTGDDAQVRLSKVAHWKDVAAGVEHTCALRLDGSMACFGRPPTSDPREDVTLGLEGHWGQLGSGQGFSCALDAEAGAGEGIVACWGAPTYEATMPPDGLWTAVSLGYSHGCVQDRDGILDCWGWEGHGATEPPPEALQDFDLGYHFGCGIDPSNALTCWGKDLHNGNLSPASGSFVAVDVGAMFACALPSVPGVPVCWGEDGLGQATPPASELIDISLGSGHGCGLEAGGTIVCWGDDVHGQASPPEDDGWVQLSAGAHHTCAVDHEGWMACWGWNESERATPPE